MINIKLIQIMFIAWVMSRIFFFYMCRLFDNNNGKISVVILFIISGFVYILGKAGFLLICTYELFIKFGNVQLPVSVFLLACALSLLIPRKE